MGYDFGLYRRRRKGVPKSDVELPEVHAQFAATAYPRFLRQLAEDAGLAVIWSEYRHACAKVSSKLNELIFTNFDPERPFGFKNKKERRRARKRNRGQQEKLPPHQHPEVLAAKQKAVRIKERIEVMTEEEPLLQSLLAAPDAEFDSAACARIGPCIRKVADKWEPAPEGWVGWRESALEIAQAMELAAEYPDVVFFISG